METSNNLTYTVNGKEYVKFELETTFYAVKDFIAKVQEYGGFVQAITNHKAHFWHTDTAKAVGFVPSERAIEFAKSDSNK